MVGEQPRKIEEQAGVDCLLAAHDPGRADSQRRLLRRLLVHRFGPLDEETATRLETASAAELEAFSDRIYGARSLDEVLA